MTAQNAIAGAESAEDRDRRLASLGRLAATMAHEFNNVLMAIQPFVELMSQGRLDAAGTERALKHITLSIERGKQITAEVLRIAHPAAPIQRSVDVGKWLRSMEIDLRAILPNTVELRIDVVDDAGPLWASLDVNQMNQVITNLITNGKDAMPAGGGAIEVLVERCDGRAEPSICITVSDTGRGMEAAMLERVFEPLFTTKRHGTGLGLAVVKQIIQRHGGSISVESSPGQGTSFRLVMPAASPPELDERQPVKQEINLPPDVRLLLIEDDAQVSAAIASALRHLGLHVDVIHTGGRAVEAVRQFASDAVILDVGLPDISGRDVFRMLRQEFPRLPIVFSTAHADATTLGAALAAPSVAFVSKPYSTEALLVALEEVVHNT